MTGYLMTNEGNARFRKRKLSADEVEAGEEGYKILDYIFDHGGASLDDIARHTGLSRNQVTAQIAVFLSHGLVEGTSTR